MGSQVGGGQVREVQGKSWDRGAYLLCICVFPNKHDFQQEEIPPTH